MASYAIKVHPGEEGAPAATVVVSGEVDLEVAPDLHRSILGAASTGRPTHEVVLDLEAVTFLDSSGIAAIVRAHRHLAELGAELTVGASSPQARMVLSVTGVDQLLQVRSVDESVASS